jgi:hypothetical protein
MKNVINTLLLVISLFFFGTSQTKISAFKQAQIKNSRVKEAYDTKWELLQADIKNLKINPENYDIYLRAFKH